MAVLIEMPFCFRYKEPLQMILSQVKRFIPVHHKSEDCCKRHISDASQCSHTVKPRVCIVKDSQDIDSKGCINMLRCLVEAL